MMNTDSFDLERFLDGQRFGYECALSEIRTGRKENHWIWYVFPQLRGLGHSPNANYYGISCLEEAVAYLKHPILGARLREISEALLAVEGRSIQEIMPGIDAIKLHSSMTLFLKAAQDENNYAVFQKIIDKYYNGKSDSKTINMLANR